MTVKEMLLAKLKELGADGLCRPAWCECKLEGFAEYCDGAVPLDCIPAKKMDCATYLRSREDGSPYCTEVDKCPYPDSKTDDCDWTGGVVWYKPIEIEEKK